MSPEWSLRLHIVYFPTLFAVCSWVTVTVSHCECCTVLFSLCEWFGRASSYIIMEIQSSGVLPLILYLYFWQPHTASLCLLFQTWSFEFQIIQKTLHVTCEQHSYLKSDRRFLDDLKSICLIKHTLAFLWSMFFVLVNTNWSIFTALVETFEW